MHAALLAVLLTAVFITPGLLYRYERAVRCAVPIKRRYRLLNAPATLAIGAMSVVAALWVFAFIRWVMPARTPDVGEIVRNFGGYAEQCLHRRHRSRPRRRRILRPSGPRLLIGLEQHVARPVYA